MKLTITGRKINLRDSFKERVEKKFNRFDKFFDENADADVTVTMERNRYTIEVTVRSKGYIYRAEKSGLDLDEALDLVVDSLSAQIRRRKRKILFLAEMYDKINCLEKAVLQMNMLGHQFFMFRNVENGTINVVYRRRDGDYGLLIPEDK